jgi:hypothetical protein
MRCPPLRSWRLADYPNFGDQDRGLGQPLVVSRIPPASGVPDDVFDQLALVGREMVKAFLDPVAKSLVPVDDFV